MNDINDNKQVRALYNSFPEHLRASKTIQKKHRLDSLILVKAKNHFKFIHKNSLSGILNRFKNFF